MNREERQFIPAIAVGVIALVWFYLASRFFFNNNIVFNKLNIIVVKYGLLIR